MVERLVWQGWLLLFTNTSNAHVCWRESQILSPFSEPGPVCGLSTTTSYATETGSDGVVRPASWGSPGGPQDPYIEAIAATIPITIPSCKPPCPTGLEYDHSTVRVKTRWSHLLQGWV